MTGLWESWIDKTTGEVVETCAIITTDANALIAPMHDRMPVILPNRAVQGWLDFDAKPDELRTMLVPFPVEAMERYRISTAINAASGSGPDCVEPISSSPA